MVKAAIKKYSSRLCLLRILKYNTDIILFYMYDLYHYIRKKMNKKYEKNL